ncbi:MAG: sigma 54-interacting transcriptional regulator, partial [Victivallaceae bacterium]|nr:sigma 54-interacting transcriptional regulator [Victivallaceae bacterium]
MTKQSKQSELRREVTELHLLFDINQSLDKSLELRKVIGLVQETMAKRMGMIRGAIALLNRDTGKIFIEESYGLSTSQQKRGEYRIGQGIIGKVVETGKPVVVPRISKEPEFLNITGARSNFEKKDISFICVPIKLGAEVVGTLSVDRLFDDKISLKEDVRLLSIIASMIAQAVKLRQTVQEEKQKLIDEENRLRQELRERFKPSNIIGNSNVMQNVFNLIAQVSKSSANVLIRGDSGTGKELVAHVIHHNSKRASAPFIKVNCAAMNDSLLQSELFGHEKGA